MACWSWSPNVLMCFYVFLNCCAPKLGHPHYKIHYTWHNTYQEFGAPLQCCDDKNYLIKIMTLSTITPPNETNNVNKKKHWHYSQYQGYENLNNITPMPSTSWYWTPKSVYKILPYQMEAWLYNKIKLHDIDKDESHALLSSNAITK